MHKEDIITFKKKVCYKLTRLPIMRSIVRAQNRARIRRSASAVGSFKNKHKGERCFIIGNGPSLTADDLSKLKDETTFAVNRIDLMFDKTAWRPTYYCAQDWEVIHQWKNRIKRMNLKYKFFILMEDEPYPNFPNSNYLKLNLDYCDEEPPKFSEDFANGCSDGHTVTYSCIELAAYMGFSEIYLIGVDHNFSVMIDANGKRVENKDFKDHFSDSYDKKQRVVPARIDKNELAYQTAKKYADAHGIKIYNATRGGKLEVFERVDLDKVLRS